MRRVLIIGIGAGHPDLLTVQAIEALNQARVFFVLDKGEAKAELVRVRTEMLARFVRTPDYRTVAIDDPVRDPRIADYRARVDAWHEARAVLYERALETALGDDDCGAFLVWGDPALYDSTLRILARVDARGRVPFTHEVIPGISAVQVLAARHRIALNPIGGAVHVTTGRKLAAGEAAGHDDVVVMLDGQCAFTTLAHDAALDIYWGAYLGSPNELLIAGKLADVADEIVRTREAARRTHGWIMDTYLLRRRA
ncbi:MAG: precorrin-6A synthase (deacetylating) [Polyangiales bacterium]